MKKKTVQIKFQVLQRQNQLRKLISYLIFMVNPNQKRNKLLLMMT